MENNEIKNIPEENNSNEVDIRNLIKENIRLTREIHEMTKSVKRYVTFQKILSIIYLLIIIAPMIIAAIYLPPLIGNLIGQYQELLGTDIGDQFQNMLKNSNPAGMNGITNEIINGYK